MEFPLLFEEPEPVEIEPPAPETIEAPKTPGTALAVISGPIAPIREIIEDSSVLKSVLDNPHPIALLGDDLVAGGHVTREQLEQAIRVQAHSGGKRIGEILVAAGAVDQETVDFVLARRLGMPAVDLRKLDIDPDAQALVTKLQARKHTIMPCLIHRNRLVVAMENPLDHGALKPLEFVCGKHVLGVLAPREDIEWAIERHYREVRREHHWII